VVFVARARAESAALLRRVGRRDLADELERDFPEQIEEEDLIHFAEQHGLTRESLADRMGGSP
jgi:hypothetical protein